MLLNLLSNAVKFSTSGGAVVVRPRQLASGEFAIDVQDNGPGMTREEVSVALERFGQVDAGLERRYEGTGLGLPLARSLVELHGGVLSIESKKGRGTAVSMVLPSDRVIPTERLSPLAAER